MADVHAMAMQTRSELFDELQELTDDDLAVMTCCDPWTVKHLVAHLTALGNQSAPNFMLGMLKARGNFDRFVDTDLQKYRHHACSAAAGLTSACVWCLRWPELALASGQLTHGGTGGQPTPRQS